MSFAVVTHGGAASLNSWKDGCVRAAQVGMQALKSNESAFESVALMVVALENDGRYNAGIGASIRLDGVTVERDAAIMDSEEKLGAVIALKRIQNPVLVAKEVCFSPHHVLAGEGALLFAKKRNFKEYHEVSEEAKNQYHKMIKNLSSSHRQLWENGKFSQFWNFDTPLEQILPKGTVGAVARDEQGRFAVATSTGGAGLMLQGRVGDTPLIGSGFFAGPHGAVAATGIGEEIMKKLLSKTIYDLIVSGTSAQEACEKGVRLFDTKFSIGAIAISKHEAGAYSNREMAYAILDR